MKNPTNDRSYFAAEIRKARLKQGLTQQEHARRASISLATLQNIEAGRANPELNTLNRLASALGLRLALIPARFALPDLIAYGLPLMSESHEYTLISPSRSHLIEALNHSARHMDESQSRLIERERDALSAFLVAIRDHYPTVWNELDSAVRMFPMQHQSIRPKLRRLALAKLAEYL